MYFVFLNASKIDNFPVIDPKNFDSAKEAEYFEFIRKICPLRTENTTTIDSLVSKFKNRFSLNVEETKKILRKFIDEEILQIGYDDGVQLNVLANQTRFDIYTLIQEYPGIYISMIRSYLELGTNQTLWHLKFLLEFDYISEKSFGKIKAYAEPNIPFNRILLGFLIFKNTMRQFLSILYKYPQGVSIAELQDLTSKPRSSLNYTLGKLKKMEVVEKTGEAADLYKLNFDIFSMFHEIIDDYSQKFGFGLASA